MFSKKGKGKPSVPAVSQAIDLKHEFIELEEGAPSILSRAVVVKGNIQKNGDVHMEGTLRGNMRARTITLGATANVRGNISGDHVRCSGKVEGNITARVVELFSTARVKGNIVHETLAIEGGAQLDGMCRRSGDLAKLMEKVSQEDGFEPMVVEADNSIAEKKGGRSIMGFGTSNNKDKDKDKDKATAATAAAVKG